MSDGNRKYMISREKMFVISELLDESVKAQTAVFDVKLFKSFVEFESYIEGTPIRISTLVLSSRELSFNNTNMVRLAAALKSPFLTIEGQVIYLIDYEYDKSVVTKFFDKLDIPVQKVIYQNDITLRFVTDIVTGDARDVKENKEYDVVYRVRAKEYSEKQTELNYSGGESNYITDEDEMEGIPEEEIPEDIIPDLDRNLLIKYIAGCDREERTVMVFLLAQYLSLSSKTIIIEHDVKFHSLTEYCMKSEIKCLFINIMEIFQDVEEVLNRIKESKEKLIIIGIIDRIQYDYNFLFTLLYNNLRESVDYMIMECDYHEVPYNVDTIYVTPNTVPEILRMSTSIVQPVVPERTKFIGMQMNNLNPCFVNTQEMLAVISAIIEKNDLDGQVLYSGGVMLKEDDIIYDLFSIING